MDIGSDMHVYKNPPSMQADRGMHGCLGGAWVFNCAGYFAAWAHRLIPLVVKVHMPSGPFFHAASPVPSQRNHGPEQVGQPEQLCRRALPEAAQSR